jgi:hypothetical protein
MAQKKSRNGKLDRRFSATLVLRVERDPKSGKAIGVRAEDLYGIHDYHMKVLDAQLCSRFGCDPSKFWINVEIDIPNNSLVIGVEEDDLMSGSGSSSASASAD